MSRVERHKERREGNVTGIGREQKKEVKEVNLTKQFDVNPIIKQENKEKDIKRKKTYNNPVVSKSLNLEEIKEKASGSKKELFDIEEAFSRLETKRKVPDHDTQLEIMSELFSNNGVEYNDIVEFEKDYETNRIMISEDELIKLLEEREKVHLKALEKKRRREKKKENKKSEYNTTPYIKEDFAVEEVSEIKKDDSVKNRIVQNSDEIIKLEEESIKKNWPLLIILIILIGVLIFLIYSFLN